MDYSPRKRYHARRRALAARRRRRSAIVGMAAVVILGTAGWWAWSLASRTSGPSPVIPATIDAVQSPAVAQDPTLVAAKPTTMPGRFFNDLRMTYEPDFYVPQVQAFLEGQPGTLKTFAAAVGNRRETFASIVVGQSIYYSVNPKVILALLESQSQLLSSPAPTPDQLDYAMGLRPKKIDPTPTGTRQTATPAVEFKQKGLTAQVRWAVRQLVHARRNVQNEPQLVFADESKTAPPADWEPSQYAIASVLAPTTTPDQLEQRMQAFIDTYSRLFGDPRPGPTNWPGLAAPFLVTPLAHPARVTSFFDHDAPFLSQNGGTFSYWGRNEPDLSYDGHDGWDYGAFAPDPVLAAAPGTVVFSGNADDNCATTAVVIDHQNGYRTLYWHLSETRVADGQQVAAGDVIGIVGASGCAQGQHLHLGVQYLGRATDPYGYCGSVSDPWAQNPAGTISTWLWADRPSPCGPPPTNAVVVDTDSPGFSTTGSWQQAPLGYGGSALYAQSVAIGPTAEAETTPDTATAIIATAGIAPTASARYQPELPHAGRYRLLAYVPYVLNGLDDAVGVEYHIQHHGGVSDVSADFQQSANEWLDLGTYDFDSSGTQVTLDNRAIVAGQSVWADALMWLPVE